MAIAFAKLYETNGKLIYDEYFQRLKEEEENRVREHDAASLIQLVWHEYKERKYRKLLFKAVVSIQKYYRGYISRVRTKKRIIEENKRKHKRYYNEKAILIQKIWRGYYSRKEIFDYYAYKQYLKEVTKYTFKVNEEIKQHAEQQRKQMESEFFENEEKKIQDMAGRIHHVLSTKVIDGVCKYPNVELIKMYQEKAYENELKKIGILPMSSSSIPKKLKYINTIKKSRPTTSSFTTYSKHQHHLSTPSKIPIFTTTTTTNNNNNSNSNSNSNNNFQNSLKSSSIPRPPSYHSSSQRPSKRYSWSASYTNNNNNISKKSVNTPSSYYASNDIMLTEEEGSYSSLTSLQDQDQDIYTLNEKLLSNLNISDKIEYTGYENENYTEILKRKDKLLPPISSIPESIIKNSEALKEWKKKNINRPRSMIPLQKEIIFKEDIPPEYLKKKADGPFMPTYLLNRKLKGPNPEEFSLRNQTDIYETPNKLKEEKIDNDKKILYGPFKLGNRSLPYKYTNVLEHNEPWVQPKDPNLVISETAKFEGKHDFRTRFPSPVCYDAYKEDFE
ncbi:hypothetical protein BCR32DRAFT_298434 [Anaeromyces robustus]|uniref:Uncharacterized protein n=1 Tax=Anaeromyces robustus TaxID=1754192 RepID=A0A1Y1VQ82_9FUNG|nr:hypothetical protein BCR32DRAFT_298434 [Anaeromyces robustus]|eukprot:ORX63437.1 hypothetical protein BCR32DRAFT_298434 [Anaeromyces robustus]